jgi:hypothetical protein
MRAAEEAAAEAAPTASDATSSSTSSASVASATTTAPAAAALPEGHVGRYELVGVVGHVGRGVHDGHYVGFVRDEAEDAPPDQWLVRSPALRGLPSISARFDS